MADVTAQRTLVKSPPELWSELSEAESLARHLDELGEIRITKVEPETTVAWEGEHVRGTVQLEQSGWGTKVTLNATVPEPDRPAGTPETHDEDESAAARNGAAANSTAAAEATDPAPAPEPIAVIATERVASDEHGAESAAQPLAATTAEEPDAERSPAPQPKQRGGFWARLFRRRRPDVEPIEPVEPDLAKPASDEPRPPEPEPAEEPAVAQAEPAPGPPEEAPTAEPAGPRPAPGLDAEDVRAILDGTLEALGQAHHRPFSRA